MVQSPEEELVFVVDVTSFTEKGFIGTTNFAGGRLDIEFDDVNAGISITGLMAEKIGVRKGSPLLVIIETEKTQMGKTSVASVGKKVRISDSKTYYAVGKEGGAVVRIRRS